LFFGSVTGVNVSGSRPFTRFLFAAVILSCWGNPSGAQNSELCRLISGSAKVEVILRAEKRLPDSSAVFLYVQ
jgi:hypothetical protein